MQRPGRVYYSREAHNVRSQPDGNLGVRYVNSLCAGLGFDLRHWTLPGLGLDTFFIRAVSSPVTCSASPRRNVVSFPSGINIPSPTDIVYRWTLVFPRPESFFLCRGGYADSYLGSPFAEGAFPRPDTFSKTPYHNGITALLRGAPRGRFPVRRYLCRR